MVAVFVGIMGTLIAALAGYLLGLRAGQQKHAELSQALVAVQAKVTAWTDTHRLVEPFAADARAKASMSEIAPRQSRGDLPLLLEDIRARGKFSSVSLVDERGLLLAHAGLEEDGDLASHSASLALTLIDRNRAQGLAQPWSLVIHDDAPRAQLLRMVSGEDALFVVSVFSEGRVPRTDELDPALPRIRTLLRA